MTRGNRLWLAMAIHGLIEERFARIQSTQELDGSYFDHLADVVISAAHVMDADTCPEHCKVEVVACLKDFMTNLDRGGEYCAEAVDIATEVLQMASAILAKSREHGPDESGCDPGGGPMAPDDRDLNDPW